MSLSRQGKIQKVKQLNQQHRWKYWK